MSEVGDAPSHTPDAVLRVTYLTAPDCHLCERGRHVLAELGERYPLSVREVGLHSVEGRKLLVGGRVPFPPGVFAEGRLVGHGRLSVRALARRLASVEPSANLAPDGKRG